MEINLKVKLETGDRNRDELGNVPAELRHAVEEFLMGWSPVPVRVELVEE